MALYAVRHAAGVTHRCHSPVTTPAPLRSSVPRRVLLLQHFLQSWIMDDQSLHIVIFPDGKFQYDSHNRTLGSWPWVKGAMGSESLSLKEAIIWYLKKTQQELSNYLYKTQAIQNYYGCHNSGGSGVILGNLSSLAASHEPPLLLWWLPSRGFPNESPPISNLKKFNLSTQTMHGIGLIFSPVSISYRNHIKPMESILFLLTRIN